MAAATNSPATASQLDLVFDGTWIYVPGVDATGKITSVDIYSPACGHPQGVYFANQLNPSPWPESAAFYMLDPHSYALSIERGAGTAGMNIGSLDTAINHCVGKPRPIASNWDLLVSIAVGPDAWTSSDTIVPETTDSHGNTVACFTGKDAPAGKISSMQTLTFLGVTGVELLGAPANVQSLLPAPWSGNGTLIFEDEVAYIPTLQHERTAIFAMANLAGLDLALDYPLPPKPTAAASSGPAHPQLHTGQYCGSALIVLP